MICDLENDTFYAKISLNTGAEIIEIDSRPSDAIALAVRVNAPIYAENLVLDKAGVALDEQTGKPIVGGEYEETAIPKMTEDELNRLSAFKEFIGNMDLEDFGAGRES